MIDYFVLIWDEENDDKEKEIKIFRSVNNLFDFLQDNKDKKFAVYEGKCVIDWS